MENNKPKQPEDLKYFIYCRKSSEDEGKQILSLPAQKRELLDYAKKFKLNVVGVFTESKSAFKPGRDVFYSILDRIENREGNAFLTWQANRIARNSLDGGRFIYLMDEGKIKELRTPGRAYTTSSDDKFILNIEFGMAKKDSDDKSANVKRGNNYKFHTKRDWIGPAKLGFENYKDEKTKENKIRVDKSRFNLIQKAIHLILSGNYTPMEALHKLNNEWGFRTRKTKKQGGRPIAKSGWYKLLSDPYYYGLMVRSEGEVMGKHTPMISKSEFDKLQIILGRKGKPRISKHDFPYKEHLQCGECNGSVTCEEKWQIICSECKTKFHKGKATNECPKCHILIEQMKNPKILHYVFYHCTKRVNPNCSQGSITLQNLEKRILEELQRFEIPEDYRDWAIKYLNELNDQEDEFDTNIRKNISVEIAKLDKEIKRFARFRISEQFADYPTEMQLSFEEEGKSLISQRKKLMAEFKKQNQKQEQWLAQSKEAFDFACTARYTFADGDIHAKTYVLSKLGSNLTIKDRNLHVSGENAYFLIEKGKKQIESIVEALEPSKRAEIAGNLLSFEPVRTTWLGD